MKNLHKIDCMDFLQEYSDEKFGAVITDPPYMIGAASVGDIKSKAGSWADLTNASFWYSAWIRLCFKHLRSDGFFVCFLNWRSVPVITKAIADAGRKIDSLAVWHKRGAGTSGPRQLRPCYELIAICGMDDARIEDRSQTDYFDFPWQSTHGDSGHPAQKPIPLLCSLVEIFSKPKDLVFDPFTGSGTTAIACERRNRRFIGCEVNPIYWQMAADRIGEAKSPIKELLGGEFTNR